MIRGATPQDRVRFGQLWSEMMRDLEEKGGDVRNTPRSLGFYLGIFDAYVQKELAGVAGVATTDDGYVVGAILWGSPGVAGMPYDNRHGRVAIGWGTTVAEGHRGYGLSRELRDFAARELARMGFDALQGSVQYGNEAGRISWERFGGVPVATVYYLPLAGYKE